MTDTPRISRASWLKLLKHLHPGKDYTDKVSKSEDAEAMRADPPPPNDAAPDPAVAREKAKRKIRALLRKTTKAGCTEDEAKSSLAKARELMTVHVINADDLKEKKKKADRPPPSSTFDDFLAYLPEHEYIHLPTGKLWPAATINSILGPMASFELDATKPVSEMAWCPGLPRVVYGRVHKTGGDWIEKPGENTFNTYEPPPELKGGDKSKAKPWLDHIYKVFNKEDADHIIAWIAHKVQYPEIKINHGIIVGSDKQGVGKDTAFEPLVAILGSWNVRDVSAEQSMDPKFNPHLEALFCRISEATDLGESTQRQFYGRRKTWLATPPNTLSVADKNVKAHPVQNVVAIMISTNDRTGGVYLPPEDRRHYVAWSERVPEDFRTEGEVGEIKAYWLSLYAWFEDDGNGVAGVAHVAAYLKSLNLVAMGFSPKAPPPKTSAFWDIASAGTSTEDHELADLLDHMGLPLDEQPQAVTLAQMIQAASGPDGGFDDIFTWLGDRRNRRAVPHRMGRAGYVSIRNPDDTRDGLWMVGGKRTTIYAHKELAEGQRLDAARVLVNGANAAQVKGRKLKLVR